MSREQLDYPDIVGAQEALYQEARNMGSELRLIVPGMHVEFHDPIKHPNSYGSCDFGEGYYAISLPRNRYTSSGQDMYRHEAAHAFHFENNPRQDLVNAEVKREFMQVVYETSAYSQTLHADVQIWPKSLCGAESVAWFSGYREHPVDAGEYLPGVRRQAELLKYKWDKSTQFLEGLNKMGVDMRAGIFRDTEKCIAGLVENAKSSGRLIGSILSTNRSDFDERKMFLADPHGFMGVLRTSVEESETDEEFIDAMARKVHALLDAVEEE